MILFQDVWGALILPVLTVLVLFIFFKKRTVAWEYPIPFVGCLILVIVLKICINYGAVTDKEFWGGYIIDAVYDEAWDERVPCQHETCISIGEDSEICTDDHPYDVKNHPADWFYTTNNGTDFSISKQTYEQVVALFAAEQRFMELNRDFHSIDGDRYYVSWDEGDPVIPVFTEHNYENRLQAVTEMYNWRKVTDREFVQYELFNYPPIDPVRHTQDSILGKWSQDREEAESILTEFNSVYGRSKQLRVFILVYHYQPERVVDLQEQLWRGGNKNEFILAVNVDNNESGYVSWARVISWTEVDGLKEKVEAMPLDKNLDLLGLLDEMLPVVKDEWKRKEFSQFDKLKVVPSVRAIAAVWIITLLLCVILAVWIIANSAREGGDWDRVSGDPYGWKRNRRNLW